jgi:F-type H+-transporting ATPase subunit delta
MRSTTAANRYAKALYQLAREERKLGDVRAEVEGLAATFADNPDFREALLTPLHPAEERKAVLVQVAERGQLSKLLQNFCSFLIDQRRMVDFDAISDELGRLADEDAGLMTAEVISASPLDDRRKDRLRRALSERTSCEVKLDLKVDPSLIGGAIAKVGDLVFDGSLRTQLSQLRANLMKES